MDEDAFEMFLMDVNQPLPGRRFRRADLAVLGLGLLFRLSNAVTSSLEEAHDLIASHANYEIDRDAFHEEAARELETLIAYTEEEDG